MNAPLDLVLAVLHHLGFMVAFACLLAEAALLRVRPTPAWVEQIAWVDLAYGIAAGLVLSVGLARVAWGVKGAAFYLGNPVFWMKLGLFVVIGLISVIPTLNYLRWRRAARTGGTVPDGAALAGTRRWVHLQIGLFVGLPLLAAMMARGVGY